MLMHRVWNLVKISGNVLSKLSFGRNTEPARRDRRPSLGSGFDTNLPCIRVETLEDRATPAITGVNWAGGFAANGEHVDVAGDGRIFVGSPAGVPARVDVHAPDGSLLGSLTPYGGDFVGGVYVAAGDVTGDGVSEVILGAAEGGGPRVIVLDGTDYRVIADYFGIADPNFRGGVRVAAGDVNADGKAEVIAAAGKDGGPRVSVWDGNSVASGSPRNTMGDFFAFEDTLRNGVYVACGDVNRDGFADIITGAGPGGGPRVVVFSGANIGTRLFDGFVGDSNDRSGVRVGEADFDRDGYHEIVYGSGASGGNFAGIASVNGGGFLIPLPSNSSNGAFVGTGDLDRDGYQEVIVGHNTGSGFRLEILKITTQNPGLAFLREDNGVTVAPDGYLARPVPTAPVVGDMPETFNLNPLGGTQSIEFTVNPANLEVTAISSNPGIVGVSIQGTGGTRRLVLTPVATGSATVTLYANGVAQRTVTVVIGGSERDPAIASGFPPSFELPIVGGEQLVPVTFSPANGTWQARSNNIWAAEAFVVVRDGETYVLLRPHSAGNATIDFVRNGIDAAGSFTVNVF